MARSKTGLLRTESSGAPGSGPEYGQLQILLRLAVSSGSTAERRLRPWREGGSKTFPAGRSVASSPAWRLLEHHNNRPGEVEGGICSVSCLASRGMKGSGFTGLSMTLTINTAAERFDSATKMPLPSYCLQNRLFLFLTPNHRLQSRPGNRLVKLCTIHAPPPSQWCIVRRALQEQVSESLCHLAS